MRRELLEVMESGEGGRDQTSVSWDLQNKTQIPQHGPHAMKKQSMCPSLNIQKHLTYWSLSISCGI